MNAGDKARILYLAILANELGILGDEQCELSDCRLARNIPMIGTYPPYILSRISLGLENILVDGGFLAGGLEGVLDGLYMEDLLGWLNKSVTNVEYCDVVIRNNVGRIKGPDSFFGVLSAALEESVNDLCRYIQFEILDKLDKDDLIAIINTSGE